MPELQFDESKAREELTRLREQSAEEIGGDTFNCLLYGDNGTGKSHALSTLPRKPIVAHSFDPHGLMPKPIRELKESGDIITDTRFEAEDARNPTAFDLWEKEMLHMRDTGVFNLIGSYCLDSMTMWSQAILNYILKKKGRPGGIPQLQDYLISMNTIRDWIKLITSFPCDFVVTAHIDTEKDEVSGKVMAAPMVIGKAPKVQIPILFSEMYVMTIAQTQHGPERKFMTSGDGYLKAKTAIGSGIFETYEEPNFAELIRKSGFRTS